MAWLTSTAYTATSPRSVVVFSGETYACLVSHTSGTFATDLAATKWIKVSAKGADGAGSGDMVRANNLSDLTNTTSARSNIGLSNVENKTSATIRGELTSTNVTDALTYTPTSITGSIGVVTIGSIKTALTLVKADVGLGSVDNTADTAKPVSSAQQAALDLKEPLGEYSAINTPTAAYTLALADKGKLVSMNVGSAHNLTVPANASVAFPVKSRIDLFQQGAGQTTILADTGVTIRSASGLKIRAQYAGASLVKIGTNEWALVGDTAA